MAEFRNEIYWRNEMFEYDDCGGTFRPCHTRGDAVAQARRVAKNELRIMADKTSTPYSNHDFAWVVTTRDRELVQVLYLADGEIHKVF